MLHRGKKFGTLCTIWHSVYHLALCVPFGTVYHLALCVPFGALCTIFIIAVSKYIKYM
jgi:hypothetical protein